MDSPRLNVVTCSSPGGLHRMACHEWGDADNPEIVLCVHGLTRTGRDFDTLARKLSSRYRVVCPDVVGRGLSDWLNNPAFYSVAQYAADMVTLIGCLRPKKLHWIGTSMGGLIGLAYAGSLAQLNLKSSLPRPVQQRAFLPASGLVLDSITLNDVGPHIEPVSLARIGQYVAEPTQFHTFEAALAYVKTTCASFGAHDPDQWKQLTEHSFVEQAGLWVKHYDLALAQPFTHVTPELAAQGEAVLWGAYSSLQVPTLIIRGAESDLLSPTTCATMLKMNPRASLIEIPGVGHAPTLMNQEQISLVLNFLLNHS
jgi:pimeloyl-ACP methyl ester carboxylesterase